MEDETEESMDSEENEIESEVGNERLHMFSNKFLLSAKKAEIKHDFANEIQDLKNAEK